MPNPRETPTQQPTGQTQEPGELTPNELDKVAGGVTNIMKTKHDTVKNTISNIH